MAQTNLSHEFRMAALAGRLPAGLLNMHSSNPAPLSFKALAQLLDFDAAEFFSQLSFEYAEVAGSQKLRTLIAEHHYQSATAIDILTTCGAQEALFIVMNALLSTGDEVLCFSPIFEPLYQEAAATGAQVTAMLLLADDGWGIDWPLLERTIGPQTRMLIINFPHNPTGSQLTKTDFQQLLDLCARYDCWLISDEVFRGLEHQPEQRLPAAVDCYEKAVSIAVMSKAYGLPAIRLGWIACRQPEIIKKFTISKRHLSICGSALDEAFAARVIPHSEFIFQHHTTTIRENLSKLKQLLTAQGRISCHFPTAGATCFPLLADINSDENADEFIHRMAIKEGLMLMPGSCFLSEQPGFRLTLGDDKAASHFDTLFKS